jgi:hypothetical protein
MDDKRFVGCKKKDETIAVTYPVVVLQQIVHFTCKI